MATRIIHDRYGKSSVRLVKLSRDGATHALQELTVQITLEGDFVAAHLEGDNRRVLPTDTMKNTVYALGRDHPIDTIESFAIHLADHFVDRLDHVTAARVEIAADPWRHAPCRGADHGQAFMREGPERRTCEVVTRRGGREIAAGLTDLLILKTARSGFSDFFHDDLTTLADTDDRILGTSLTARWTFPGGTADFAGARETIRTALIDTFCEHDSRSVQHTLHAMGDAALAACPAISRLHLSMPNRHCLLADLTKLNLTNDNQVFVPVDEPFGLIEATLERG